MTRTRIKPVDWGTLGRLAVSRIDPRNGVVTRTGYRALRGAATGRLSRRAVSAADYLAVCAYLRLDPLTQKPATPDMPACRGRLETALIAAALQGKRRADGLTLEQAAVQVGGVSAKTLCRIGQGRATTPDIFRRLCVWLGRHPNDFTVPDNTPGAVATTITEQLARIGGVEDADRVPRSTPKHDRTSENINKNSALPFVTHVKRGLVKLAEEAAARAQEAATGENRTGTDRSDGDGSQ